MDSSISSRMADDGLRLISVIEDVPVYVVPKLRVRRIDVILRE